MDNMQYQYHIPSDDFDILAPVSEVYPNLFMGGCPSNYDGYDVVVNLQSYPRQWSLNAANGKFFVHYPMYDEDDFELDNNTLSSIALLACDSIIAGRKVLIHCTAGLNRSGVVTALTLWFLGDENPIETLREKRDKWVLCNPSFEAWLRESIGNINKTLNEES